MENASIFTEVASQDVRTQNDDLNVLIVEDEAMILLDLSMSLESLGFHVAGEAMSIDEGFRLAKANKPDVAVLDINVGADPVWPLARQLASNGVAIVFVSANLNHPELMTEFASSPRLSKPATDRRVVEAIYTAAREI